MTMDIKHFPEEPGVYLMKDENKNILYIGKAKNLKKRVSSYFTGKYQDLKTKILISYIHSIDYIVTHNEIEALLLECNLIKTHKPYFNIDLKDQKTYPYIKVTLNEKFPRVLKTRNKAQDGSKYFGPYTSVRVMRKNLNMIHDLFPIRECNKILPLKNNQRPCLNYHIGRCEGACMGKISEEEYQQNIQHVITFLRGHYHDLIKDLKNKMQEASNELKFERAARIRDQIGSIKAFSEQQRVFFIDEKDVDVIGIFYEKSTLMISFLLFREGKLLAKRSFPYHHPQEKSFQEEEMPSLLEEIIETYYHDEDYIPQEIITYAIPENFDILTQFLSEKRGTKVILTTPKIGYKKELLKMAINNAKFNLLDFKRKTQNELTLSELKQILNLPNEPRRIEGFDIAHTDGKQTVAAMVSFFNGIPDKRNYRHFKIRSVNDKVDDYASIKEAIHRRYKRAIKENLAFPDLILVDGGKGQLSTAFETLTQLEISIPIIALAKKEELIYQPAQPDPIELKEGSAPLRLLQAVRDEAHRFGNTFHKKLRTKNALKSILEDIEGIGPRRREKLMQHFKTIDNIKNAPIDEIKAAGNINEKIAKKIKKSLSNNK